MTAVSDEREGGDAQMQSLSSSSFHRGPADSWCSNTSELYSYRDCYSLSKFPIVCAL
jgi:hypothetical protein